jgi:hypothetical protein
MCVKNVKGHLQMYNILGEMFFKTVRTRNRQILCYYKYEHANAKAFIFSVLISFLRLSSLYVSSEFVSNPASFFLSHLSFYPLSLFSSFLYIFSLSAFCIMSFSLPTHLLLSISLSYLFFFLSPLLYHLPPPPRLPYLFPSPSYSRPLSNHFLLFSVSSLLFFLSRCNFLFSFPSSTLSINFFINLLNIYT